MGRGKPRWSLQIRTFLVTINLVVLMLPIVGIVSLRLVENLMHRQTEAKLTAEFPYIQALYLEELERAFGPSELGDSLYRVVESPPPPQDDYWRPHFPTIDLSREKVLPAPPEGEQAKKTVYPAVRKAGNKIEPVLKEAQRYNLSGIRVLDANGVVIASTGSQHGEDLSNREEVQSALRGHYRSVLREREKLPRGIRLGEISRLSRVRVFVAIPMIEGDKLFGVIYLHRTSLSFFRDMWEERFATVIVAALVLTMAISLVLAYYVTRPLKSIIKQSERIAAGEPGVSLSVGSMAPTEVHQLSQAMSKMVAKMQRRLDYVEEFSKNVSHEFKTPLTSIQGSIELLEENWEDMPEEQRKKFLEMIRSDAKRMETLVRRLLQLTRIEVAEPTDEITDLAALMKKLAARYLDQGHDFTLAVNTLSARAKINPDMAETMFVNLVENAITHGKGAPVAVAVNEGPSVMVQDMGPGISRANLKKIWERFFTTARAEGGTGLGLPMVKAIAEANGADVAVDSDEGGTTFTVIFRPVIEAGEAPGKKPGNTNPPASRTAKTRPDKGGDR